MNLIESDKNKKSGRFEPLTYIRRLFILSAHPSENSPRRDSVMRETSPLPTEITAMLRAWDHNQGEASEELMRAVYQELRRQARYHLRRERVNHTLQTTALINEAYLKLVEQRSVKWESRTHFFALAAEMMRRILVDYAKAKYSQKRGGKEADLPLEAAFTIKTDEQDINFMALDQALNRLHKIDPQPAKIVELRYFGGLSVKETAQVLNISPATVKRDWAMAKAWLRYELSRTESI
jgi:RNA polymerase sigma factor (TIGR02999 family)